jgi:hypothetical protein
MSWNRIDLPYYKQGDDLAHCINQNDGDVEKGLLSHAEMLREAAQQLEDIASLVSKYGSDRVEIEADTHCIMIDGPKDLLDELVEQDLATAEGDIEELEDWNNTGWDDSEEDLEDEED